jgi:hypothetical protein
MKIVETSNFDEDDYPEKEIATGITNDGLGRIMAGALNARDHESRAFYRLVPDDYVLRKGFEP